MADSDCVPLVVDGCVWLLVVVAVVDLFRCGYGELTRLETRTKESHLFVKIRKE